MSKDSKDTKESEDTRLFDMRNVGRNIKRGLVSRKDYERYLKNLPDVKAKAAPQPEGK